jgi:hypothetical protein
LPADELGAFVGRYRVGASLLPVALENGKLRARSPALDMNFLLQPASSTELFDEGDQRYHFVASKDQTGKVVRLTLRMGDREIMNAVKVE